jgi:hypothetical protein
LSFTAVIGKQCAGEGCNTGRACLLASSALVEDATLEGVVIGKQCAIRGCNNSSVQLLASSALAEGLTIEGCDLLVASVILRTRELR